MTAELFILVWLQNHSSSKTKGLLILTNVISTIKHHRTNQAIHRAIAPPQSHFLFTQGPLDSIHLPMSLATLCLDHAFPTSSGLLARVPTSSLMMFTHVWSLPRDSQSPYQSSVLSLSVEVVAPTQLPWSLPTSSVVAVILHTQLFPSPLTWYLAVIHSTFTTTCTPTNCLAHLARLLW